MAMQERGVGECALRGRSRTAWVPEWLEKWAALIMEYVETEQALLPQELLALRPPYATYTPASAAAEAKGEETQHCTACLCDLCTTQDMAASPLCSLWAVHM